jgi:hypothetical protein
MLSTERAATIISGVCRRKPVIALSTSSPQLVFGGDPFWAGHLNVFRRPNGGYEAEAALPYSVPASAVDQKFSEAFWLDAHFTR